MEEALKLVFVPDQVRNALLSGRGDFHRVLDFVMQYEQGYWQEISRQALILDISISDISDAYVDAVLWYSHLINMTDEGYSNE
jgi:c-di-GMP-related signal transduction protein